MKSRKKPVSTSVDQEIYDRIAVCATVDNRSFAEVLALAAVAGLPIVEERVARSATPLRPAPAPARGDQRPVKAGRLLISKT